MLSMGNIYRPWIPRRRIDLHVNTATFEAIPSSLSNRICDRERGVLSVIIIENMAFGLQLSPRSIFLIEYKYLATFHII